MPIRIFCSCCGETLKDIRPQDLGGLSGQELCGSCEEKFEAVKEQLDKTHAVVLQKLDVLYKTAQQDLTSIIQEAKRSVL